LGHQGLMLDSETGLYYNRARMLHPTLGRDPLGYIGGVNLYGYARNTPILLRDPLGLLECNKDNEGERRGVALETVFSPRNNNNPGDTNRLLNFAIILLLISDIPIPGVTNPAEILRFFHANEPTGSSCRKQGASSACDMNVTRWCAAIALGLNGPGVRARSGGLLWVPPWSLSLSDGTSGTTCFGTIRQVGWICVVLRQSPTARCP
jgi:RHS repeat-associated protein